jgi:hypothetical protein
MTKAETELKEALAPLRKYLKKRYPKGADNPNPQEPYAYNLTPAEARRVLEQVQEVGRGLLELERTLDKQATVSRALG